MKQFYPNPAVELELPRCPRCGTPMWLARIEPDNPVRTSARLNAPRATLQFPKW